MTYLEEYLNNRKKYSKLLMSGAAIDSEIKKKHKARQDELLILMSIEDIRELIKLTNNPQAQARFYKIIKEKSSVATIALESYKPMQHFGRYTPTPIGACEIHTRVANVAHYNRKISVSTAARQNLYHFAFAQQGLTYRRGL